jgi:hypothetical protein
MRIEEVVIEVGKVGYLATLPKLAARNEFIWMRPCCD